MTFPPEFERFAPRMKQRLQQPLPGRSAWRRFEPTLSYGRPSGPTACTTRRAAVALLLYPHEGTWTMPLTLRPRHMVDHGGQVSLPGGAVDPNESSQAAALRELDEELGVTGPALQVLGRLTGIYVFASDFFVIPWVIVTAERPRMTPSAEEVEKIYEISLENLLDHSTYGRHEIQRGEFRFTVPHIRHQDQRVWGATCMILGELIALLGEMQTGKPPKTSSAALLSGGVALDAPPSCSPRCQS